MWLGPGAVGSGGTRVEERAEALRAALEKLGPVFIKAGQLLSTRPDLLSEPYLDALQRLQSRVAPMEPRDVDAALAEHARALGMPSPFASFDRTPIAAASLAQVHRAVLHNGVEVAVKLRRPGLVELVERDLATLSLVTRLAQAHAGEVYDLVGLTDELGYALRDELCMRTEAETLAVFGTGLARFAPLVRVPAVYEGLTTDAVLVSELVRGQPLSEAVGNGLPHERRRELAEALTRAYFHMFFVDGVFHADPHPGNVMLTDDGELVLLDFGMVGRIERQVADNLVRVLLSFLLRDSHGVAHAFLDVGKPTRGADELGWIMEVRRLVPRYHGVRLERLNLGTLLIDLLRSAAKNGIQTPPVVALVCKSLANMDGTVRRIDPTIDVLGTFRDFMPQLVEAHARRMASPERAAKLALDVTIGSQRLPFQIGSILEKAATGRLRFVVDPLSS
jgi:ubiquinone biosynthesis protein